MVFNIISIAVAMRRDLPIYQNRAAEILFFSCFILAYYTFSYTLASNSASLYGGLHNFTLIAQNFSSYLYLLSAIILQLTAFYPRKVWTKIHESPVYKYVYNVTYNINFFNKMTEHLKKIEYPLLIMFIIIGAVFFMTCGDIVSIFLSIELQSYGLYLLIASHKNSEWATAASLNYYLLGGLSSSIILLGSGLIYSNYGITMLDTHYIMTHVFNVADFNEIILSKLYNLSFLDISLLIIAVGLLFKSSCAPFHFWSPDVYDAIPTIVTTFVAIIAKISILVLLLELVHYTSNLLVSTEFNWTYSLLISSFLSFIIGSVLGLSQTRIKKLLAYSTISHLGFMLLSMSINTMESVEAFVFYLLQYSLSNLNTFFILIAIGFSLYPLVYENKDLFKKQSGNLPERNNSPIQLITELKGYYNINPILALSMAISLFSLIGIPPLMGFFAKQLVLMSALNNGYFFMAITAILTSVISASYYLNVIKEMFFNKSSLVLNKVFINRYFVYKLTSVFNKNKNVTHYEFDIYNLVLSSSLSFTIATITILLILFMFVCDDLLRMTRIISLQISELPR